MTRKAWKFNYPVPDAILNEIVRIAKSVRPNDITVIVHWKKKQRQKTTLAVPNCVICGNPIPKGKGQATGYIFTEQGKSVVATVFPFDTEECANKFSTDYFNPIMQNEKALELFKTEHSTSWKKRGNKPILFAEKEEVAEVPLP